MTATSSGDGESTRIAVVGVGAIGGAVAADLWDLGRHSLVLCVRSSFECLEVRHPGGTTRVEAAVLSDPRDAEPVDWVLLATKAHQSAPAAAWLGPLSGPQTRVAVLQNGVDHVERIAPLAASPGSVVPVVVQLPSEKSLPGRVVQSRDGQLVVPEGAAGRAFASLFEGARTAVRVSDDFLTQAWWKLLSNAALGGVCALALRENGAASESSLQRLVLDLMSEVASVGRAEGARLPEDAPQRALDRMLGAAPDHWSSISVDRREGRPMEWEARNAVVGRLGRRHGIPTPLNDAVTTLLKAADRTD